VTFRAAIFDLDGVVTRTARLHAAAWKALFDEFLRNRAAGSDFEPFDEQSDYLAYVDGKPRLDGIRSFLESRRVALPEDEIEALAARKTDLFRRQLDERGVETFPSTLALIEALRERGVRSGMVTSSRHGREILGRARIAQLFDACLDGNDLASLGLKGKPEPDMFLACARALGAPPAQAIVFEDAVAGVQAGRRGDFGLVVAVDRGGNHAALERAGADVVVRDLGELDPARLEASWQAAQQALAWSVEQEGFDPAREAAMESLFTAGNGYLGVRGALDAPLAASQGDLLIAGIYDRKRAHLPYSELEFLTPERDDNPYTELVALPFPFRLRGLPSGKPRDLRRRLDLRRGLLRTQGSCETLRCASAADPHLLLQEARGAPDGTEATLEEPQLAERYPHLQVLEHRKDGEVELARYATLASGFEVCIASRSRRDADRLRRLVSVFTSRDGPDPRAAALAHVGSLEWRDFEAVLRAHEGEWGKFWDEADIRVPGNPATEQALRFLAYHLRIAAAHDPRVSVPARALTGRAYEGHVFWDTEIFMLPFYLHVDPAQARSLLLYRHHTLEGARRRARELGYRGACYAWESTVTGDDVTPDEIVLKSSGKEIPIFTGTQQIHVTADVAYAVWRYWEATRDEAFLAGPGAEILFETARFWASRIVRGARHGHIRGVVGPDEYHHGVNDNAYTNWLARFNLERAVWLSEYLERNQGEAEEWREQASSLFCPGPNHQGVIEQFEGFFALGDYPLPSEERFKAPLSRLFDWQEINRLKVIKQADVLMLPMLFPDDFTDDVVAANYRYYEPLTDHGSSLSPAVHAAIAARIGMRDDAERYWKQALWLDLSNAMDNSALGVHPAAMGGTWQALVFGFLGVRFGEEGPAPHARAAQRLLPQWNAVEVKLAWRGKRHAIEVRRP
jgi:beta-phosphoglucomutase family hydrolase